MCSRPEESELGGTGFVEHVWPMCRDAVIDAKCQPRSTCPAHPVTQFEARDASVPMASNHPAAQGTPVATRSEAGGTASAICHMHETQVRPSAAACQGDNCSRACTYHAAAMLFAGRHAGLQHSQKMEQRRPTMRQVPHRAPPDHTKPAIHGRPGGSVRHVNASTETTLTLSVSVVGRQGTTVPMCKSMQVACSCLK
jgi:hypothetical protein